MTRIKTSCWAMVVSLATAAVSAPSFSSAQDLAITNARVIVGNGTVIDSGTIVVRGGKIVSVSAGAANTVGSPGTELEFAL